MYRSITDFITDWQYEREATLKIMNLLTDETVNKTIHENVRSLERLAWHLTQTMTEMGHKAGLFDTDLLEQVPTPGSAVAMAACYQDYSERLAKAVHTRWTDSRLEDQVEMYGDSWTKGTVLRILINHQSHHRGQMTVIMRLLGLPVPGLYGPSKEEWAEFGMEAPS